MDVSWKENQETSIMPCLFLKMALWMFPGSLSRKTVLFKDSAVDLVDVFASLHEINTYENEELK